MPIDFTCPHCGASTHVADQYAGQTGPCAHCGKPITVPPLAGGVSVAATGRRRGLHPLAIVFIVLLALSVPIMGILVALLLPAVQAAREAARRVQCSNNIKEINVGLLTFENAHGHFPAIVDPNQLERPPCSWRVQILPHIGHEMLFPIYDLAQPWDAPDNQRMAGARPSLYHCPSNPESEANEETDYLAVSGEGTVFPDVGSTTAGDCTDGASNTIMIVESHASGIHWMEPRDMSINDVGRGVNGSAQGAIRGAHHGGANVGMVDGSVRFLSDNVDPAVFKAMTTIDGGEQVDSTLLDW